mmetsp:Transcript_17962/g.36204  ORF Transcript_17962/g.36204 Transcript_17962/m.36204 type:complete len:253 (-) Transcript_17962:42-800(-)
MRSLSYTRGRPSSSSALSVLSSEMYDFDTSGASRLFIATAALTAAVAMAAADAAPELAIRSVNDAPLAVVAVFVVLAASVDADFFGSGVLRSFFFGLVATFPSVDILIPLISFMASDGPSEDVSDLIFTAPLIELLITDCIVSTSSFFELILLAREAVEIAPLASSPFFLPLFGFSTIVSPMATWLELTENIWACSDDDDVFVDGDRNAALLLVDGTKASVDRIKQHAAAAAIGMKGNFMFVTPTLDLCGSY